MTGLQRVTGFPIAHVRGAIEVSVVIIGWLLGGVVGAGTLLFAFGIGPCVAASMSFLQLCFGSRQKTDSCLLLVLLRGRCDSHENEGASRAMKNLYTLSKTLDTATARANKSIGESLPLDREQDFEAASRGQIAPLPEGGIDGPGDRKAWDIDAFDFLNGTPADTVNPSLWRMARLNAVSGLVEVCDGVWQARAFDYANMTIIRGETGWILVDPLMAAESAAAALATVNATLGERPVSAVIITHTHPDHFGGIRGVVDADNPPPIYAPEGFMEYAASEGVLGGNHTSRRAVYQFGITLEAGPEGLVDGGIGKTVAKGRRTFVAPTEFVGETGEERVIDGVRFVFMMASGTEAPAEFTFFLPEHSLLCMAEVCTQTMHNLMPPRGAQVRDALLWARCIDQALTMFGDQADCLINCHNWPVWGREELCRYLEEQRDIYKYIHDQTLRLANTGLTPNEIAAQIEEPDWLSEPFTAAAITARCPSTSGPYTSAITAFSTATRSIWTRCRPKPWDSASWLLSADRCRHRDRGAGHRG